MSLYQRKGSPFWHVSLEVVGAPRLRRSTGTADRQQAQRIHDEWKAQLWALVDSSTVKDDGHSWSQAVEAWLEQEERSESELLSLKKFGGKYPDRSLSQCSAESFEEALGFCQTAGTYTRYRTMITAILNLAKAKGWITKTPVLAQKKDKKKKPRKWITHEQWDKLLAELPPHMKPMAEFALETGLRQANVLGLTWDRVSLPRRVVWMEAEDTKDDDPLSVPLSARAVEVLQGQLGQHEVFVFTFRGKPVREIKTAFIAACIRAGLGRYEDGKYQGFTWHGLRHTWATWHVQNQTPLDVLKKLGGWSDMRMVENYAHHSPGYLAAFADNSSRRAAPKTGDGKAPRS